MADFNQINQFGSAKPARSVEGASCAQCEAMLTDVTDGALSPLEQAAFDRHIASCDVCSQMLADVQRGAALLEMLKSPRPEPSAALLDRILAATVGVSGQIEKQVSFPAAHVAGLELHSVVPQNSSASGLVAPPLYNVKVLPFRSQATARFTVRSISQTMLQPRLAMTAAMAFFSIALTLNLTGVHLAQLRASDLKPSSLKRSFYQADASVVRYYDNLRVVYELESRVRDLQRSSDDENAPAAAKPGSGGATKPGAPAIDDHSSKKPPKPGTGTSQRLDPLQQQLKLAFNLDRTPHNKTQEGRSV